MKIWNPTKRTMATLCAMAAFSLPTQAADEALIELVPEGALFVMRAASAKELPERLQASPLGKFWNDAKIQKFMAPAMDEMKDNEEMEAVMKAVDNAIDTFDGETVISLNRFPMQVFEMDDMENDSPEDVKKFAEMMVKDLRFIIMGKVEDEGFNDTWKGLIETVMEESKEEGDKFEMLTEKVGGDEIHFARETPNKVDKSYDVLAFAQVGDVGFVGSPRQAVEEAIQAMKKGVKGGKLTDGPFGRFHERNPDNDAHFHINVEPMIAFGQEMAKKAEADGVFGEQAAGMGVTVDSVWKALGLADLESIDLGMQFEGESTVLDTGLLFKKRSGLTKFIAYTNGELPKAQFVPQDVDTATISLFSFEDMYGELMNMLGTAMPNFMPMVKAQIAGAEGQLGVSIEKDLFGNMKPEMINLQSVSPGEGDAPQEEMVIMVGLKNEQGFEVAFDKVMAFASGMTGMTFEPSEFLGHKLHSLDVPDMGDGPTKISYLYANGYFTVSMGKGELLRKVLSNIERPGKSVWDLAHVKDALGKLEPDYCEVNYVNAGSLANSLATIISDLPDSEELPVDWDSLPTRKEWDALLGFLVSGAYMEKDGFYGKSILLPNED